MYLASDIQLIADAGRFGPRLKDNSFGDRSFSAAMQSDRVWNALQTYLRRDMNYRHFKQSLKGHMFTV